MEADFLNLTQLLENAQESCEYGQVSVMTEPTIQASVECVHPNQNPHFPGTERLLVQMTPDLNAPHDLTYVIHSGYGENPKQEADKIRLTIQTLLKKGWENPLVITPVPQGRGTPAYNAEGADISTINFKDYLSDVRLFTEFLLDENLIQGTVIVEGHSLGNIGAMVSTQTLLENETDGGPYNVHTVIDFMGANGLPLSLLRPGFLWTVGRRIPDAIAGYVSGKDAVCLTHRDYNFMMLNRPQDRSPNSNSSGNECDSARVFMGIVFNIDDPARAALPSMAESDVNLWIVSGGKDRLIPKRSGPNWFRTTQNAGVTSYYQNLDPFSHSSPYHMDEPQEGAFVDFLNEALPEKK